MKEMITRMREEKGGFTLAELLIVVAIILVLVAIAVPVFTANLDKAKEATDEANVSNVKTVATVAYFDAEEKSKGSGKTAIEGDWYVDKDKNVVKSETELTDALAGPYTVAVTPGTTATDTLITVTPPATS